MNINLQITHKETKEVKIPVPSFWKEPTSHFECYRAILDEKTFIDLFVLGDRVRIQSDVPSNNHDVISEAYSDWTPVAESEFMQAYDDAWESIRMRPQLIDTGREEAVNQLQQTENY